MTRSDGEKLSKEDVIRHIIGLIERHKFVIGEKIYSENQLAADLGVSRAMVREAYVALECIGVLKTEPGDGTYLTPFESIPLTSPLSVIMSLFDSDLRVVMQFRKILEIGMIASCIERIQPEQIEYLQHQLQRMRCSADYHEIALADVRMHTMICESIGNPMLSLVYSMITNRLSNLSNANWRYMYEENRYDFRNKIIDQHREIIEKIMARDTASAQRAVEQHLNFILHHFEHEGRVQLNNQS